MQAIRYWKKGEENPFTTNAKVDAGIEFQCPMCSERITYPNPRVEPILGGHFECNSCKDISHIPSAFFSAAKPPGLKITAGVLVPIAQWSEWYHSHPAFCSLLRTNSTSLHDNYGLWAFCARCYYLYQKSVLSVLSLTQQGGPTLPFGASSIESALEMRALTAGHCPRCGDAVLIAIMADVPVYVREAIETWKHTGVWPR